jgi:hypothetical protein
MWSNNNNRKAKAINIKSYLGGGRSAALSVELEENNTESSSLSSNAAYNSCQSLSSLPYCFNPVKSVSLVAAARAKDLWHIIIAIHITYNFLGASYHHT